MPVKRSQHNNSAARRFLLLNTAVLAGAFLFLAFDRKNIGLLFDFLLFFCIFFVVFFLAFFKRQDVKTLLYHTSIFLIMHFLGHFIVADSVRLYDTLIFEYKGFWLRWDNIMHLYAGFILFNAVYFFEVKKCKWSDAVALLLLLGFSALHEILEFAAVFIFNIANEIGDYTNNSLDLLYGFLGGVVAIVIRFIKNKRF